MTHSNNDRAEDSTEVATKKSRGSRPLNREEKRQTGPRSRTDVFPREEESVNSGIVTGREGSSPSTPPDSNTPFRISTIRPPPSAKLPTHEYEPLEGGSGKEIHYRQARNAITDLLGFGTDILHTVEFGGNSGTIINFGINGVAFSTTGELPPRDHVIPSLGVTIGDDEVYRGRASIRYCRIGANGASTVGVVLLDGILDADAMIAAKNRALASRTAAALSFTLNATVSRRYKEAMADLVLLLSCYRRLLEGQQESIESLSNPMARSRASAEVLTIAINEFSAQYDQYRKLCNELTSGLIGAAKHAHREYTEAILHPYILTAPLAHHCYNKPLGYPGDYMLMSYLYDPEPQGKTLYDKLVHEVVCRNEPMGYGVVKRKDYLLDCIRLVVHSSSRQTAERCRILSLACGPAREVVEFVTEHHRTCGPTSFTLIDQDQRSLTHVNSYLSRVLIPGSTSIETKYLYLGFMQMIAELDAFDNLPAQDLIYAAGLFDYIKVANAQNLTKRLFDKLKPGGKLIIGNFRRPNESTWALEYWMDWHLIYRTRDEMSGLTELIEEEHDCNVATDASGYTYLLELTRGHCG